MEREAGNAHAMTHMNIDELEALWISAKDAEKQQAEKNTEAKG